MKGLIFGLIYLVFMAAIVIGYWKMFTKAGKPGIAAIVPFWNILVMLEIIGKPSWWIVLFFIPGVGAIAMLMIHYYIGKAFGKNEILTAIFAPFMVMAIGFGDAKYLGVPAS